MNSKAICNSDSNVTNNATLINVYDALFRGNLKIDGSATVKFFNSTVKMTPNMEKYVNYGHDVYGPNDAEANLETLSTLYYQHGLLIDSVLDRETDTLARKAILELIAKNYQYKVDLASLYADDLDFDRAMHILQTEIPAQFNLQKEEQDALDHLAELYEVEQKLYVTGADWVNLAENVKDNVHYIANLGEPYAGGKAMELLVRFEGMVFQPDYVRIVEEQTINQRTKLAMNEWGLYPNPGKNTVHIEWFGKAAHLELRDITGRLVMAKDLKAGEDNFDASAFATGIYLARLSIDGVQKNAIKFVKE